MGKELTLIRHGMTESNKQWRYLGRTDEELCEEGILALEKDVAAGRYGSVRQVFASPMRRCRQTASILYPGQEPVLVPEWVEMDFGIYERKKFDELKEDAQFQEWISNRMETTPPGGESIGEFAARCRAGFERVKGQLSDSTAFVIHGGTIMALLSIYCGGDYASYRVDNGGGYACVWEEGEGRLRIRGEI